MAEFRTMPVKVVENQGNHKHPVIEEAIFDVLGVSVTEQVIIPWGKKNSAMLVWTLTPFNQYVVNGRKNPCVYEEFDPKDPKAKELLRHRVRATFCELHKLGEPDDD